MVQGVAPASPPHSSLLSVVSYSRRAVSSCDGSEVLVMGVKSGPTYVNILEMLFPSNGVMNERDLVFVFFSTTQKIGTKSQTLVFSCLRGEFRSFYFRRSSALRQRELRVREDCASSLSLIF